MLSFTCLYSHKCRFFAYTGNMKSIKAYSIFGILFVILTGTLSHFVYEWSGNNFILGFLFPVNESVWEHMKLIFFPMLLYSFYMNQKLKDENPCVSSALLSGILIGTFRIPVIYYTYSGVLGSNNTVLDIATFLVSVLLAFYSVYRLSLSCSSQLCSSCLVICVWTVAICFLLFTYLPPDLGLFENPPE